MRITAFELQNDSGLPLRGDVRCAVEDASLPTVIVCHGFKGFKDWGFFPYFGERLARSGFLAVCFNFSGSGIGSDLQNFTELDRFAADTVTAQLGDFRCVVDALASGDIGWGRADLQRLAVVGHSRGGAIAVLGARDDRRIGAVVTWAGVSTLERWNAVEERTWRAQGYAEFLNARTQQTMRVATTYLDDLAAHAARYDLARAVSQLDVPLLVVHGASDTSVPAGEARALHAAARPGRAELLVVPETGHTFGIEHPWKGTTPAFERVADHTMAWLHATLAVGQERSAR